MTDLDKFTEPDRPKLTTVQMQRAVYKTVRDVLRMAREESLKASLHLAESEMRLQNARDEDKEVGWNRDVQILEKQVRDANSRLANREDNLHGWQEILDFVVMSGLGAKPSKIDYPVVENGSGI